MIKQGRLIFWGTCLPLPLPRCFFLNFPSPARLPKAPISAALNSVDGESLTAKERRQLRNEKRENNSFYNWREEVENRLMKRKPKRKPSSWMDELNLDNLSRLGPQWWVVRVSRVSGQHTADLLARSLARNFPTIDFKIYAPAVYAKRKLKNGSLSVKPKPLFPGCIFLRCIMNKEIHDFVREFNGIGGFVGSKVGNTKRQINKPKPVDESDMEEIFRKAKEEQDKADQAFEAEQKVEGCSSSEKLDMRSHIASESINEPAAPSKKPRRGRRQASESIIGGSPSGMDDKLPNPGSTVQVVSGAFAGFSGILQNLEHKTGLATVGFTLFGKETLADINISELVPESN